MKATLHTDGGSRGNPGPAACAFILRAPDETVIDTNGKFIGIQTNNIAEYSGLIMGLIAARKHNISELFVFSDSELMINQILGKYKIKNEKLQELASMVHLIIPLFNSIEFLSVRREDSQITIADGLVNHLLDEYAEDLQ